MSCTIVVCVTSVQAEDGSRESWNIEGEALEVKPDWEIRGPFTPPKPGRVFIYFRTDGRGGRIRFLR